MLAITGENKVKGGSLIEEERIVDGKLCRTVQGSGSSVAGDV
jgi:hypothetical protein